MINKYSNITYVFCWKFTTKIKNHLLVSVHFVFSQKMSGDLYNLVEGSSEEIRWDKVGHLSVCGCCCFAKWWNMRNFGKMETCHVWLPATSQLSGIFVWNFWKMMTFLHFHIFVCFFSDKICGPLIPARTGFLLLKIRLISAWCLLA